MTAESPDVQRLLSYCGQEVLLSGVRCVQATFCSQMMALPS